MKPNIELRQYDDFYGAENGRRLKIAELEIIFNRIRIQIPDYLSPVEQEKFIYKTIIGNFIDIDILDEIGHKLNYLSNSYDLQTRDLARLIISLFENVRKRDDNITRTISQINREKTIRDDSILIKPNKNNAFIDFPKKWEDEFKIGNAPCKSLNESLQLKKYWFDNSFIKLQKELNSRYKKQKILFKPKG